MKIIRTGAYKNRGTSTLTSDDLTRPTKCKWGSPYWSHEKREIVFGSRGLNGRSTHDYEVDLAPPEILHLVELMVQGDVKDSTSRAVALGAVTVLRELLIREEATEERL